MKKFFGWFFILAGVGNLIGTFAIIADGAIESSGRNIGEMFMFGVGFLGLGIYLLNSSKKKDEQLPSQT